VIFLSGVLTARALADAASQCSQNKDLNLAIEACTSILDKDPRNAEAFYNRGGAYLQKANCDKAKEDLDRSVAIAPDWHLPYYQLGQVYSQCLAIQNYDKAIELFSRSIRINPNLSIVYRSRGFAYQSLRKFNESIADFTRALEINP